MTISDYEALTGITVTNVPLVTAQIAKTQRILEMMLGYTLDTDALNNNEYVEIGKTALTCPCPNVDMETLLPADDVVYAYRLYRHYRDDTFFAIDPATQIHAVKLVKDGITFRTFESQDYRTQTLRGIIQYLERCKRWCFCIGHCYCTQLAVDATWSIAAPILDLWAEMVTYYSNPLKDIKMEVLGTHRYERLDKPPETLDMNIEIMKQYAGPNGTCFPVPTV